MAKKTKLRSAAVYGRLDRDGFIHRSWMKNEGLPDDVFRDRPIIGICNTWSELTPCNAHLREIARHVKRGVWEAGGVPLEFPAMSLGETQMRPTAMLFRNLLAMEVEESIRANPIDGVVLLGGCDKTTPGQLMGAASVDLPTIIVSSGPMLNGRFRGKIIGSGTDVWRLSEEMRAGALSTEEFFAAEAANARSAGTCNTMGTASTMSLLTEAMGLSLPYNGTLPAADARRKTLAHLSGRQIVRLVKQQKPLSTYLSREAFENAIIAHAVCGGSTNAVVHLLALAGRAGVNLCLQDFDYVARDIPLLVNLKPSGQFLMEEFHYAGGLPAALANVRERLHLSVETVSEQSLGDIVNSGECFDDDVIRPVSNPVRKISGVWVLEGNLCPNGAIIKPNAASPALLQHKGRAIVFENIEEFRLRVDDSQIGIDENSIMVLRGCGPKGYPGMPEVGNMPLPKLLLERGIRDVLRITDARMSGTAYGSVILHVSPESEDGGPLALVSTGDVIHFDGPNRRLDLLVSDDVLAARKADAKTQSSRIPATRGYEKLYVDHVLQADKGCDFDFLVGQSGDEVTRESH